MRADVTCPFCATPQMHAIGRESGRALVHCTRCAVRLWVPAILVDYRRRRRQLIEAIDWIRYKVRVERNGRELIATIIRRHRLELAELRSLLAQARQHHHALKEAA